MTRAVLQLVRMHQVVREDLDFRLPGEPGYSSCLPPEYCGGCDGCLAMQHDHCGGPGLGGWEEYDANLHAHRVT